MKPQMPRQRAMQRIAHTIDNIGGRDLPHAAVHLEDGMKAPNLKQARDHMMRAAGHIKESMEQSQMLSEAIKIVPGVVKEAKRLAVKQAQSDGLVQDQSAKKGLKTASKKAAKVTKASNPFKRAKKAK